MIGLLLACDGGGPLWDSVPSADWLKMLPQPAYLRRGGLLGGEPHIDDIDPAAGGDRVRRRQHRVRHVRDVFENLHQR